MAFKIEQRARHAYDDRRTLPSPPPTVAHDRPIGDDAPVIEIGWRDIAWRFAALTFSAVVIGVIGAAFTRSDSAIADIGSAEVVISAATVIMGPLSLVIAAMPIRVATFAVLAVVHGAVHAWMWFTYLNGERAGDSVVFATGWLLAVPFFIVLTILWGVRITRQHVIAPKQPNPK
ncbi:MAG: hypothetical protein ACJAXA_002654 [Candidatus Aldehydirespiratoraceae bacterium]|jgi:hypothetical protein